jgi:hypothetical protein
MRAGRSDKTSDGPMRQRAASAVMGRSLGAPLKSWSWDASGTPSRMAVAAIHRSPSWTLSPSARPACWHRMRSSAQSVIIVVGLGDGDLGDAAVEPSTAQLAPPGAERAEAEFHDVLEGEHDGLASLR